jgi:hypothetical protein
MPNWCDKLNAFLFGMIEFKSSFTKHYEDYSLALSYDYGRSLAHKLTFNKYEESQNA